MSSPAVILKDHRALVAIDLGAESCRVSLLRWHNNTPQIEMLHRISNGPKTLGGHLHWPLDKILQGVEEGLRKAAASAPEGIRSIAVDGWAVDYVRLNPDSSIVDLPYCYRDERNILSKTAADKLIAPEDWFAETGAQPLRINTAYQLLADKQAEQDPATPWILLPEYILHWLGANRVAEYTNATHTGLVHLDSFGTANWSHPIFERLGLDITAAPPIVPAGSVIGKVKGRLSELTAFADTELIAPACHDTASAIAAIPSDTSHTAYIVSGTWSLVGAVVDRPICTSAAEHAGFTNQGAAAGGYCFHTNVNGMWILKQCLDSWKEAGRHIDLPTLIAQAAEVHNIPGHINVDAAPLMLSGNMPDRINNELLATGSRLIPDTLGNEPIFARVIFESLAARYATVLKNLEQLTGRTFKAITILGGGSRNTLLTQLTEQSTNLPCHRGEVEGSTLGNFAIQLAALEGNPTHTPNTSLPENIRAWATYLAPKESPVS